MEGLGSAVGSNAEQIREESNKFYGLNLEIGKVIVGQEDVIQFILIAILSDGHILLEGIPGLAKTTMIKALTRALGLQSNRVQFTPDLLPADLIGSLVYNPKTQEFQTRKGPIFSNLVLADEINRAPAKVQAALLEAMQERQITIGTNTFQLDEPFLVFATQNPLEQEGTYRLPEAQVDRFMFKLHISYPRKDQEREILKRIPDVRVIEPVLSRDDIFATRQIVKTIYTDEKIVDYIIEIVFATRTPEDAGLTKIKPYISYGASPRATLALQHAAKAHAFLKKRHFVTPDDVKAVAHPILRHRITLTYEAEADGVRTDEVITQILSTVRSP